MNFKGQNNNFIFSNLLQLKKFLERDFCAKKSLCCFGKIMSPFVEFSMIKPDDWHCHFREGDFLKRTVLDTAAQFQRALVMPNLKEPITSVQSALSYQNTILAVSAKTNFQP